ncbi:MAG: hypothetical protein J6M95_02390 [Bacilli bacterium]|nr:hypothetical protein [Bacilli bacterium]
MRKKVFFVGILPVFLLAGTLSVAALEPALNNLTLNNAAEAEDPNQYDYWLNSISKPGHLYLHYNRGESNDYNNYCLWLWQSSPQDLEGALWGFSGETQVSPTLKLKPMTTSWMTPAELGKSGTGIYVDDYGAIMDVDLYRSDLVGGKTGTPVTYEGAEELGFLLVQQNSMDGKTNWTSDGGRETYIDDIANEENWRSLEEGKAVHIFVSKGSLSNYKYYAGDGVPEVKINPIDLDTTGKFSSEIDATYEDKYGISSTSEAFKKLGVGYQIFVASFRDSNSDGIGDIRGVINSLDYLKELGTDVIWLTPIQKSDSYHGYDISDYFAVDKRFGTIEDYRELIYKAHKMGMKVIMDLVLNHTSKGNVWFVNSQWGTNAEGTAKNEWRDIYTWKYKTDKIEKYIDGSYKTITVEEDATSSNPSWYRDGESSYYYYGKFGSGMPEINYQNAKTRELVINMAKYWLSFGLDGYRLDAVKHIFMRDECYQAGDTIVPDTGSKRAYDDEKGEYVTKDFDYSSNLTKNVTWWKEFANSLKADYPNCFLVGENFDGWGTRTSSYYRALDSQFSFSTYYHIPAYLYANAGGASNFSSKQAAETFEPFSNSGNVVCDDGKNPITIPGGGRPDFIDGAFTSNHDVMRAINQVNGSGTIDGTSALTKVDGSGEQVDKAKIHAAVTLLNRGISWIYYGDELGMSSNTDQHISKYGSENSEDIWYRQPFLWKDNSIRANYKSGQYLFELDSYNKTVASMEEQKTDPNSMLNWYIGLSEIKHLYPEGAKITYHSSSSNNVMVIKVDDASGNAKLVIYLNIGTGTSNYMMNPDDVAGKSTTFAKALGNAPTNKGGDIGAAKYSICVWKAN